METCLTVIVFTFITYITLRSPVKFMYALVMPSEDDNNIGYLLYPLIHFLFSAYTVKKRIFFESNMY